MGLKYISEYNRLGVNLDETMERFMQSEEMYIRFLKRFPADKNFDKYMKAVDESDVTAAFEATHALKGVTANLGLGKVLKEIRPLVEVYRAGRLDADPDNIERFKLFYHEAIELIGGMEMSEDP